MSAVFGRASYGAATITTSATPIGQPLGNRENIIVYNASPSNTIYVGTDANVTASTGYPILSSTALSLDFGPQVTLYAIVTSGTGDARWMEAY